LSAALGGPELWIKRDDLTGLATGGNKTRKLEFLVADALYRGADEGSAVRLITAGAAQSNHARQTAAAAAKFGLQCTLVLEGSAPSGTQGNLLLDQILGADVLWSGDEPAAHCMERAALDARANGEFAYVIPYGGSNPVGASGYVAAMEELMTQCSELGTEFNSIVFASSSGGTQAGLIVGARRSGFSGRIVGISVGPPGDALKQSVADLASRTADYLGVELSVSVEDVEVEDSYVGDGYGVVGPFERDAIAELARSEGILLDPVYTGRAFGGLLDMIGWDTFQPTDRVLFWHTGGTPALFAYAETLAPGHALSPVR
jgi:D-cysteine desulfhydrase